MALSHDVNGDGRPLIELSASTDELVILLVERAKARGLDDEETLEFVMADMDELEYGEAELIERSVAYYFEVITNIAPECVALGEGVSV